MRMLEKVLVVFAVLSLAGKFMLLPEAEIFFLMSMCALILIYLLFGIFLFREKESGANDKLVSFFSGFIFSVLLTGILFKGMLWQTAGLYLRAGLVLTAIAAIVIFCVKKRKQNADVGEKYYKIMIQRCVIMIIIGTVFFLIPSKTLIRLQFRNDPKLAEMIINCRENKGDGNCWEEIKTYRENQVLQKLDNAH